MRPLAPLLLLLAAAIPAAAREGGGGEPPFPPGMSSQVLEGLRCSVVMPAEFDPGRERSLVVILHGAGGTETGMAGSLQFLAAREFVVVAPKSTAQTWDKKDVDAVRRITADLVKRLRVGEGRLHAAGFSNGGWNLAPLAFDDDLRFASACWIAAGYNGGSVPKRAKKEMGVLALAGENDANRSAAEKTPELLRDKVRTGLCLIQPGKGHEWTDGLMDFYGWWLEAMEGRYEAGRCLAFDWVADPAAAEAKAAEGRTGRMIYWHGGEKDDPEQGRILQNETFLDPLVRWFGSQMVAEKRAAADDPEGFAAAKIRETPAVVVVDRKGKVVKTLQGRIPAGNLAAALRAAAPDKSVPKR